MKDWDDKDGNFDVSDFFDGIVDMLQSNMSVKDTKYRKSLLAWWNKFVVMQNTIFYDTNTYTVAS